METTITREELEKMLEGRIVCEVLDDIHMTAQRWNKGGALIHKVRAMGYLADSGAENIRRGVALPINEKSTFKDMQLLNKEMYTATINFMYGIAQSKIYVP